ncbi:RNA-directed DNA polymerase from mobile element jockey-like [Elysia marginata]|uniref:RNA-directed DNA polymerase from mobile element jockey-like n=1 Tax=Elysia marginata TaxID=1093978 RepID=A0AAV4IC25_9GAST|nr:RNA-directed DNA polymerase from mobile element jockey-like [Elysia marginata]
MDFTHCSRNAWQAIKKLDPDSRPTKSAPLISPDEIAQEIKGENTPNQSFEKQIRKEYKAIMAIKESPSLFLSAPITRKELEKAIKCMKKGQCCTYWRDLSGHDNTSGTTCNDDHFG